jgi:hypothetical protein
MIKPIHKLNNGNGATLCNCCSKIISIGLTDALYCDDKCESKHRAKILMFLKQMDNEVHKNNSNLNK